MLTRMIMKKYIKDEESAKNAQVREEVGKISSLIGIGINVLLCTGKITIGTLFNSVSITADGINNLSDAGNSLISFISFRLSARPADEGHPFGHARYEYIASMIVGISILLLGVELIKNSVDKILHPEVLNFSYLSVAVLVISILAKCWMYLFNKKIGKKINSSVMEATAVDSLSDCFATSGVLLSLIISQVFSLQLDGYMGVIVACFILFSGFNILRETLNNLLGTAPDYEFVKYIENKVKGYEGIYGIHDLMVHSYGPNRWFATLHAEVESHVNIMKSHDLIDNIERDFLNEDNIHLVIHLDPVVLDDPQINELHDFMKTTIQNIDSSLELHDFRVVLGETHSNLIFDLVIPFDCSLEQAEIQTQINLALATREEKIFTVITFERPFAVRNS